MRVWDNLGALVHEITPFPGYKGGVFVETGDVNGNGQLDLLISTAGKTLGRVQVYEFIDGGPQLLVEIVAFGPTFTGQVQVAAGDVTGGPEEEIIVAQGTGGGEVRVYSFDAVNGGAFRRSFRPYGDTWTRGVTVASDNIHNTFGLDKIITGRANVPASQDLQCRESDRHSHGGVHGVRYHQAPKPPRHRRHGRVHRRHHSQRRAVSKWGRNLRLAPGGAHDSSFRGDTGGIIATIGPSRLFPPNFARSVNFAVGFPISTQ